MIDGDLAERQRSALAKQPWRKKGIWRFPLPFFRSLRISLSTIDLFHIATNLIITILILQPFKGW